MRDGDHTNSKIVHFVRSHTFLYSFGCFHSSSSGRGGGWRSQTEGCRPLYRVTPFPHLVMEVRILGQKPTALHTGKSCSPSRRREGRSGSGNFPDCPKQRGALFTPIGGWASATVEKGRLPASTPHP